MHIISGFTGEYSFLSNFHLCPVPMVFGYDHIIAKTAEHVYQAAKTENEEEMMEILSCETPGKAKRLGQKCIIRPDWDKIKNNIMYEIQRRKYNFNPKLKELLTKTYPKDLIENNNWNDTYWGVCNGVGKNYLGKILMHLRLGFVTGFE